MTTVPDPSLPFRVAGEDEAIGLDELGLAARNHGMPLELMRHDVTPVGAHYLLTHYDIPPGDASTWRLEVAGLVRAPVSLSLDDLRARPLVHRTVTMECAGNGRARLLPRPVSQPWLHEAVGTMTWTGTPLAPVLEDAGLADGAVDLVFTGADHGIERGTEQDYQRSLSVEEAMTSGAMLVWGCNGVDLPPQHGYPLRLLVPGWYGMASVKWLRRIEAVPERFDGFQMRAYSLRQAPDDPGQPLTRIAPRALVVPPGFPDFMSRRRVLRPGRHVLEGRAWSGGARSRWSRSASTGAARGRRPSSGRRWTGGRGGGGRCRGRSAGRGRTPCWRARRTPPGGPSRPSSRGTAAASPTPRPSASR